MHIPSDLCMTTLLNGKEPSWAKAHRKSARWSRVLDLPALAAVRGPAEQIYRIMGEAGHIVPDVDDVRGSIRLRYGCLGQEVVYLLDPAQVRYSANGEPAMPAADLASTVATLASKLPREVSCRS